VTLCAYARARSTHRSDVQRQPTLLSSCARAATAAEARYRISAPSISPRESRVIGLDEPSARVVRDIAGRPWDGGHFLVFETALPDDALLRHASGGTALLSEELDGADAVVMIATEAESAEAASIVGDAAAARGIMPAGLVLPGNAPGEAPNDGVVSALRPNAMVLVVLREADDLPEVLSALRV
jgi:hypothetical protein